MVKNSSAAKVAILMGSKSDLETMKGAAEALDLIGVSYHMEVISAHRTPQRMIEFAEKARAQGYSAIIAGAGGAAALPGMLASSTELPVIGVPVPYGHLNGEDALLSIVQMPKGVPVATVAIGNSFNAGILAAQIVGASGDAAVLDRVAQYKQDLKEKILKTKI